MNKQISTHLTFAYKWLLPLVWFGLLFFFMAGSLSRGRSGADFGFIAVPVFMVVMGVFFFKVMVWDLADAVFDRGSYLLVRRGKLEQRISFENIMNVSSIPLMRPSRVTMRLVKPGAFGTHVSFLPRSSGFGFPLSHSHPIAEQLMERAYAARTLRSG